MPMLHGRTRTSSTWPARWAAFALTLAVTALLALAGAGAASAQQSAPAFSTSFEPTQPPPTWSDTVEAGRSSNVDGTLTSSTIPGNVTDKVVEVQASGENPPNESKEKAVDGNIQSKWLTFTSTAWLQVKLSEPVKVVSYALTSANDAEGRDPQDWNLQGSNDGQSWTTLDTRTGEDFPERFQTRQFDIANDTAYTYYRLNVTKNSGEDIVQLGELQLSTGGSTSGPPPYMRSFVDHGPESGPNIKPSAGFTGLRALHYAGGHVGDGRAFSYDKVYDVDVPVHRDTQLSYKIFPALTKGDLQYPSTYAAVDLAFSDGTYLSDLGARDQLDAIVSPQGQGASKTLYADQWNDKWSQIGDVAAGKTIKRIIVGYDNPGGTKDTQFSGWIDDIRIGDGTAPDPSHLSDWADTRRGTNSSGSFSRGNNFPATAVPHGFNFWTPMTDAGSQSWLYNYQSQNNADNLPMLQAFTASHMPSPWMGDRQTFQVMPSTASGTPDANRQRRALAFRHDNEVARPYYYGVTFENGLKTEIAPTDHAAVFRFTFPGSDANLIFDNVNNSSSLTIDQAAGTLTGWSDVRSGSSNGATRMYVYATLDKPVTSSGMLTSGNRVSTGYTKFDAGDSRTVTMRIATSLISIDQAKHNLGLEVGDRSFDSVRDSARDAWDSKLGAITVQGANSDQKTTLYSNLYRLNLYPNSAFENTGTAASPQYMHAVQASDTSPSSGPTQTGAKVVPGKADVNNGFWDTYRTTWPAYSLFYPTDAGQMIDGFVSQYRDGGWISRWSSPGYANIMTGTSSDVAFADAYLKGIRGFSAKDAYDAALKNATVAPPGSNPYDTQVGRKGMIQSAFLGYTPNQVPEGLSWSLEAGPNDFGIANMAGALSKDKSVSPAQRERYKEEQKYFLSRSQDYVNLFDKRVGFFQGKSASGDWTTPPDEFDPRVWRQGGDFTETDGWNFAFHAPFDGQGLANLYGGRDKLATKLDQFFATPETAKFPGTYGGTIHEMLEARDVRMGQWGASNQVSHHIPYMYDYAGQPYKTQALVREALGRLYSGSTIGEGYPGDEDNGEMSAWYLFSALGFYPLAMGSPTYAIGSPLFKQATLHMQNGHDLVINAPNNSPKNVYVQGMQLNGKSYDRSYLTNDDIANGGRIDFAMGPKPSSWATKQSSVPPSITNGNAVPQPLADVARPDQGEAAASAGTDASALFDDTSGTQAAMAGSDRWAGFDFDAPREVSFYTLTSNKDDAASDPSAWVVKGSNDGTTWTVLDSRSGQAFDWRQQTRPFELQNPGTYAHYRIEFTKGGDASTSLAEMELLTSRPIPANPLSATATPASGRAGTTVPVQVTIANAGSTPVSGQVTASGPSGWTVDPASTGFGPIAGAGTQTVTLHVSIPAGAAEGGYPLKITASSSQGTARLTGNVQVIGDTIEFTPGTDAETPWLSDPGGSQLDGAVHDGHARFADNGSHFTYRFDIPADVTGGTLSLEIGNEFLVKVSSDDQNWRTVLQETTEEHDLNNLAVRDLDLNDLRGTSRTLYVRVEDSKPDDGWGGWLAHLKLAFNGA
jgi:predicted alpha-1,2-mannosidase